MISAGAMLARRYRLVRPIASGGMSVIWHAVDTRLDRAVAVKVSTESSGSEEPDDQPIATEARYLARVSHPGAIEVYDYGEAVVSSGRVVPFAVLPLLTGTLLASQLDSAPMPWREAVSIIASIAEVLAATHHAGIVHGDVTPENVVLTEHGPRLIDFGLATSIGSPGIRTCHAGTPPYVAPERVAGSASACSDDVYALGVMLFELLTTRRPFPETTWDDVEAAVRLPSRPIPPIKQRRRDAIPANVERLVRSCLDTAAQRPTAAEVAAELHDTVRAHGAEEPRGRRRSSLLCAAAVVIAVGVLTVVAFNFSADDPAQRVDAARGFAPGSPATPPPTQSTVDSTPAALDALDDIRTELADGVASGAVRPDVSLDIAQIAENLVRDPAPDEFERDFSVLRRKLDDRLHEGGLERTVWLRLHEYLTDLERSIQLLPPNRP